MNPYPYLATLAYLTLLAGFARRQQGATRHAILMASGMALDLGLVLTLEFTKNAVATALADQLTVLQRVHVISSTLAVVLYIPIFALGLTRLLRPSAANLGLRAWHRRLGYGAMGLRTIGFLFMFSMLGRVSGP